MTTTDEQLETSVVAGAIVVALVVAAFAVGVFERLGGDDDRFAWLEASAPLWAFVHRQAGGDPPRVLLKGTVDTEADVDVVTGAVQARFPRTEVRSELKARAGATDAGRATVLLSFASGENIEQWDRPRFGQLKRLDVIVHPTQGAVHAAPGQVAPTVDPTPRLTVRAACYDAGCSDGLDNAWAAVPRSFRGALQLRTVDAPSRPAAALQHDLSVAVNSRVPRFADGAVLDDTDETTTALLASLSPLLKDLRGITVLVSAGADSREQAIAQAQAVKTALVARGADAAGLRPVPAKANNPFSLFVLERE